MAVPRGLTLLTVAWVIAFLAAPAGAYTPGSGTLFSEDFETLDANWENGNGVSASPWSRRLDGADWAFNADGLGPLPSSPTRHWARHFLHPVEATTFSVAFELRTERGAGYAFDLEVEQRAETLRKYRLRVDGDGSLSLWRTEGGAFVLQTATHPNLVPVDQKRWLRLAIEPDGSGHPRVRARLWNGGAAAEPGSWTLEFLDTRDTLARVHRFELIADGPKNVDTWIDDLDAFGDASAGVASSITTIYVMELSHLDIGFTEPPDDIEAFAKTHLDQVLDNLEADPAYRWTIESGWWLDRWWERSTDEQRQRMVAHLRSGRLSLCAGYANLHTTVAGHEELTRSAYWSLRFARTHGVPVRTWITDDVPGSTFALPELLARSGVEFFFGGMNTTFGGQVDAPDHGDRPFWWVGPDGSRVLAWTTFGSYAEGFDWGFSFFDTLQDMYDKLAQRLPEQEEAGYDYPEFLLPRGFDNHYQGFHVRNLIDQWNATYRTPRFVLATPEEFLDMMLAKYGAEAFPSFSGDYGAAWAGSNASAAHTQAWVRQAHREGRAAEALLAAAAAVDGAPVPEADIERMYRRMLEVDEHSGAGGWPGYFTPEEMDRNNRIHLGYAQEARDLARQLLEQGLERLVADIPLAGDAVIAINPLGRTRDGIVRARLEEPLYSSPFRLLDRASGREIVYQKLDATQEILFLAEGVPAVGYRVYDLLPGTPSAVPSGLLAVTATTLENDFYRLEVDPTTGALTSLLDKKSGRELVDTASPYAFNELASNTKAQYDWQQPPVAEPPASATVRVAWSGPVAASLEVTRSGTPHVATTYRLYRNVDRVEFENVLDRDQMPYVPSSTSVRAYTVTLPFDIHDFQIRTETTTRFLDPIGDSFPRSSVFDWHNAEHTIALWDQNVGIHYGVDAVSAHHLENLSSLTSAAYSTGDALVLSRLKDESDEYQYEDGTVGPYEIEPGTSPILRYTHHVQATPPAFDPVAASRFGFEALTPLQARVRRRQPGNLPGDLASFARLDTPDALLYTLKTAEVGTGLVLRMTELRGEEATVGVDSDVLAFSGAERVEQDEEGGTPLAADGDGFLVTLGPYETATVRVQASPRWSPIQLLVDKNPSAGTVQLSWSGGVSPYTVRRAEDPAFTEGVVDLVDEQPVTSHDDPVLFDGRTYYYLVR